MESPETGGFFSDGLKGFPAAVRKTWLSNFEK